MTCPAEETIKSEETSNRMKKYLQTTNMIKYYYPKYISNLYTSKTTKKNQCRKEMDFNRQSSKEKKIKMALKYMKK